MNLASSVCCIECWTFVCDVLVVVVASMLSVLVVVASCVVVVRAHRMWYT